MPRPDRLAAVERLLEKWEEEIKREAPMLENLVHCPDSSIRSDLDVQWGSYNTLCQVISDLREALGEVEDGE